MEISSIGEILRRNANRQKYNSGFLFYKGYVSPLRDKYCIKRTTS